MRLMGGVKKKMIRGSGREKERKNEEEKAR